MHNYSLIYQHFLKATNPRAVINPRGKVLKILKLDVFPFLGQGFGAWKVDIR